MYTKLTLAALALSATIAPAAAQQDDAMRLTASGPEVTIEIDGTPLGRWQLDLADYPRDIPLPVRRPDASSICFVSGDQRACADFMPGQKRALSIAFAGGTIATVIEARPETPAARFDQAYRAAHRGQTVVEVPEVYELVNIAIAISPYGRSDRDMVYHDSAYYAEVQAAFADHADHPLIGRIDAMLRTDRSSYFPFKMNAYAFTFDPNGEIVRSPVYDRTGFAGSMDNDLLPYLADLNDFARTSGFREFYARHRALYDEQIRFFQTEADVAAIARWLSAQFPSVQPYDGVKIIFSPLVAYNQSLTTIEADGYRELQPHVNFPYDADPRLSPDGRAIQRSAILFTEMNHGFVNPVTEGYAAAVSAALADRAAWADDSRAAGNYRSAEALFNEYMNWALVSLYYADRLSAADFDRANAAIVANQQQGRGMRRFAAFDAELLRLYRERPEGATIESLFPAIVDWFTAQGAATGR